VFARPQVKYLGFVLSQECISPSHEKVKAVKLYPALGCKGGLGVYRAGFILQKIGSNIAVVVKPLTINPAETRFRMGTQAIRVFPKYEKQALYRSCTGLTQL